MRFSGVLFSRRYSLALLDVGYLKSSYIRGNSFHDGFNTALGVFGTNGLTIADNVVHHTVGSAVRVWGRNNKVLHNLAVLSVSPGIAYLLVQTFWGFKNHFASDYGNECYTKGK